MAKVHPSKEGTLSTKDPTRWVVSQESLAGDESIPWRDMETLEKVEHVAWIILKLIALLMVIFAFICTLGLLSDAFKLIGGKGIGDAIKKSDVIQNPISASIVGMVITLILQSSSTLISVLVGMVAGGLLTVHQAIPVMLGAEMGASFMNALISLGQSGNRDQFRRAFAAATMNDVYNFLCYFAILPIEVTFGIMESLSGILVGPLAHHTNGTFKTLSALTDPILNKIVYIDEDAINDAAASGNASNIPRDTFIFRCIDLKTKETLVFCPYNHIFTYSLWSDATIGFVLLAASIIFLIGCLIGIVNLMQSLLAGHVAVLVRRLMDQQCPPPFTWLTDYIVMVVACLVVIVVQSSGVFRSALTPLCGIGVITLERLYPLLLGANVGTTFTGVLAALSADPTKLRETMQIALCQTIYNLLGIVLFYPIPQTRKIPINLAKKLGDTTAKYRWFALVYIFTVFLFMPAALLALSFLPYYIMVSVVCSFVAFMCIIITVNVLQKKYPNALPRVLRSWNFLPRYLHSLKPYDKFMCSICGIIPFCRRRFVQPVHNDIVNGTQKVSPESSKILNGKNDSPSSQVTPAKRSILKPSESDLIRKISRQTQV
ncbi:na+/Pi-cotransporter domain-containing protein [Ditylenchus destructor]|nr:na+/Pi-cotransporter domain-containing protein [Ditylenchus destructor]